MQNNITNVFARKQEFQGVFLIIHLIKRFDQKKNETGWSIPAILASSLGDLQGLGERQAEGENKVVIDDVQKLIRVRSGPLFDFIICVQRLSLLYLSSYWFHLAPQKILPRQISMVPAEAKSYLLTSNKSRCGRTLFRFAQQRTLHHPRD